MDAVVRRDAEMCIGAYLDYPYVGMRITESNARKAREIVQALEHFGIELVMRGDK